MEKIDDEFLPWTEKYRPKKIKDIVGQSHIIEILKSFALKKSMPNLLFAGPPGVGKTTASLALAHELYGTDISGNFLELNASDERGIEVVRGKVKEFARTLATSSEIQFKIIFLDEADALTPDAQNALRRTMEVFSKETRFILSCNYSSKIIEPIQSRTAVFRFLPLSKQDVEHLVKKIEKHENLELDQQAIDSLYYVSEGDMRKVLNTMQGASFLTNKITEDIIYKTASRAKPVEIRKMLELAINGEFLKARELLQKVIINYGLSGEDIIVQIYKEVQSLNISEKSKVWLLDKVGEYNFRLVEGANEMIQIEALLAQFLLVKDMEKHQIVKQ